MYTPTEWKDGDIVTSEKLNHMEDGIEGAYEVMVITVVTEDPAQSAKNLLRGGGAGGFLDKTWQEIYDAMAQGKLCAIRNDTGTLEGGITFKTVSDVYVDAEEYVVGSGELTYSASSATGYPRA